MAGTSSSVVAPAGTDQLDLEAAEQLIQLSGGDGDAGSETRSADSVKCCRRGKKEKEAAAVESRRHRRRSAGTVLLATDGGESGSGSRKAADTSPCTARAAGAVGKAEEDEVVVVEASRRRRSGQGFPVGKGYCDGGGGGGIVHGEARRRPRFRSLADIYRQLTETRRLAGAGEGHRHADRVRDPPLGDKEEENEKKRAADEAITVEFDAGASKERRLAQSAHTRI